MIYERTVTLDKALVDPETGQVIIEARIPTKATGKLYDRLRYMAKYLHTPGTAYSTIKAFRKAAQAVYQELPHKHYYRLQVGMMCHYADNPTEVLEILTNMAGNLRPMWAVAKITRHTYAPPPFLDDVEDPAPLLYYNPDQETSYWRVTSRLLNNKET